MVDNSEVHTVKIMGIVEQVEQHATNITYRINDGSGAIECKLWVEKDGDASKHEVCNQFSYIQVVGSLKSYEGRNHILVYKATPVEDFNEMTHHFLEVILTHLQHTKGPIPVRRMHYHRMSSPLMPICVMNRDLKQQLLAPLK